MYAAHNMQDQTVRVGFFHARQPELEWFVELTFFL